MQLANSFWLSGSPDCKAKLNLILADSTQCQFTNAPTDSKEALYQSYFMSACTKLLAHSEFPDRTIVDTSKTPYLDGRKPDCTMYGAKYSGAPAPIVPMLAQAVFEIKPLTGMSGQFCSSAMGEALTFGERLLSMKPFVPEVTCALTDCHRIQFFCIKRDGDKRMYVSTGVELLGVKKDMTPHDGLLHLWLLLTASAADLKCELPQFSNLSFEYFLGSGTFGDVFAGRTEVGDGAVALKIFKREDIWEKEHNILRDIQMTLKKQHAALVELVREEVGSYSAHQQACALVLRPVTVGLPFRNAPLRAHIHYLVDGLRAIHDCGWVHCDIKPKNMAFVEGQRRAFIFDFGSAHKLISENKGEAATVTAKVRFSGTRLFASPSLLCLLNAGDVHVVYKPQMDLESLVLSVLCMAYPGVLQMAQAAKRQ